MIYKTLHRTLMIEQHEPTKPGGEPVVIIVLKPGDKQWMGKERDLDYNKRHAFAVICETDNLKWLIQYIITVILTVITHIMLYFLFIPLLKVPLTKIRPFF